MRTITIVTCDRTPSYLMQTVQSIPNEYDIQYIAQGQVEIPRIGEVIQTTRPYAEDPKKHRDAQYNYTIALANTVDGIIIEDDVVFSKDFHSHLSQVLAAVPTERYAIALYSCYDWTDKPDYEGVLVDYPIDDFYAVQGMVYDIETARELGQYISENIGKEPHDLAIKTFVTTINTSIKLYATKHSLIQHIGNVSTGLGHRHQCLNYIDDKYKNKTEVANFFWYGKPISLYEEMSLKSFIQNGFEVNVWSYMDLDLPEGAILRNAEEIISQDHLFKYTQGGQPRNLAAFSDVFRYNLLQQKPGEWWFDIDCICLKEAVEFVQLKQNKKFVAGWEDYDKRSANCAAMTIPDADVALGLVQKQKRICDTVEDISWGDIGPRLITYYCRENNMVEEILPIDVFYPMGYWETEKLYEVGAIESVWERCKDSHVLHLWNEILSRNSVDKTVWPVENCFLHHVFKTIESKYQDEGLQNHELEYWLHRNYPNKHADFYKDFFDFSYCNKKEVLDVGCGGNPITDFLDYDIKLSILDPLIESLIESVEYKHLTAFPAYSMSILDFKEKNKYDIITCLNVIDHFNDEELKFIDVFYNALKDNGELWLYYDVRPVNACDHLAVNHLKIVKTLRERFTITKMSEQINPKHVGWGAVTYSVRLIAVKK